ncbi:MAG: type II toxin-antitoxin system RelB/DinJ family antitoxin [Verrucomicrobia bacterium]|nr:type II toxin-antitoxin system RelB/DinJ family antitoxin [Verrucomicrobiota bacterium]
MSKTALLRARVNAKRKMSAEAILDKLGLSLGDGINIFFSQICIHQGIPFSLTTRPHLDLSNATIEEIEERYADRILNHTTRRALQEKPSKKKFKSSSEVLKSLKS